MKNALKCLLIVIVPALLILSLYVEADEGKSALPYLNGSMQDFYRLSYSTDVDRDYDK